MLIHYYIDEYFAVAIDQHFKISRDKSMITNIEIVSYPHTILMNKWIDSMSYGIGEWKFEADEQSDDEARHVLFGLVSNKHKCNIYMRMISKRHP